ALRLALALAALVVAALLADSAIATSRSEKNLQALNHQVLAAVNKFRIAHGLVALHESAALDRSARQHSLEMGRAGYFAHPSADGTVFWRRVRHYYPPQPRPAMGPGGYFAHPSADGTVFWRRIRHYYSARGHSYWSVGENLLLESPGAGRLGGGRPGPRGPPTPN